MLQNDLHARLIRSISNFINGISSVYTRDVQLKFSQDGYVFGAEKRFTNLADNATIYLQIEATTKPVNLSFGASTDGKVYVDSFSGSTLNTPTTLTPFSYRVPATQTPTAIVRTALTATEVNPRGENQTGSGNPGQSVGGSSSIRQTTIMPGSKVTLKLTNKAGAGKDISVGVYFTEIEV